MDSGYYGAEGRHQLMGVGLGGHSDVGERALSDKAIRA